MTTAPILVIGDTVLDRDIVGTVERVCPDSPAPVCEVRSERVRPGGAGLAARLATEDGPVLLVTALAEDEGGALLRRELEDAGVEVHALPLAGATPEKARVRSGDQTIVRLDRATDRGAIGAISGAVLELVRDARAVLVADYGRGLADHQAIRGALDAMGPRRVLVWDPHPRGEAPTRRSTLVTPNATESALASGIPGTGPLAAVAQGRALVDRWDVDAVAVTLGARGALLSGRGRAPLFVAAAAATGDACGAGDRFATAATRALASGALVSEAVELATSVAASFVGSGGVGGLDALRRGRSADPVRRDAVAMAARVRERGGTCVATGGCFDLLHAGHVSMLQAARRLGDCLIVCLNSDASVRRLKGPDRPRQSAFDRAAVLAALECVDAVTVFDEDTPIEALRALRPHVFAKGADYEVDDLPEAEALREWGGHAVALPYLVGRSTTRLLLEAITDAN